MRTIPTNTEIFRYDLDAIRAGGTDVTLRRILLAACTHGQGEAIHDDEENAQAYADILTEVWPFVELDSEITLTVGMARALYAAALSTWSYADQNNYANYADDDPNPEDRVFGEHGRFMLQTLTHPWTWLQLPMDGSAGITHVQEA